MPELDHLRGCHQTCMSCHCKREKHTQPESSHLLPRPDWCYEWSQDLSDSKWCCLSCSSLGSCRNAAPKGDRNQLSEFLNSSCPCHGCATTSPHLSKVVQHCSLGRSVRISKVCQDVWLWMHDKNVSERSIPTPYLRLSQWRRETVAEESSQHERASISSAAEVAWSCLAAQRPSVKQERWNAAGPLWVSTLLHWSQTANNILPSKM